MRYLRYCDHTLGHVGWIQSHWDHAKSTNIQPSWPNKLLVINKGFIIWLKQHLCPRDEEDRSILPPRTANQQNMALLYLARSRNKPYDRVVIKSREPGIFQLLLLENRRKIEPKEILSRLIPHLLVVFTRQLEILVTTLPYLKTLIYLNLVIIIQIQSRSWHHFHS